MTKFIRVRYYQGDYDLTKLVYELTLKIFEDIVNIDCIVSLGTLRSIEFNNELINYSILELSNGYSYIVTEYSWIELRSILMNLK